MSNQGLAMDAELIVRLVEALERLAPAPSPSGPIEMAAGYLQAPHEGGLIAVRDISRVDLRLLLRNESQRDALLEYTRNLAQGRPAINALL